MELLHQTVQDDANSQQHQEWWPEKSNTHTPRWWRTIQCLWRPCPSRNRRHGIHWYCCWTDSVLQSKDEQRLPCSLLQKNKTRRRWNHGLVSPSRHNRLRQYAKNCEFENEAREIKQQIIENCSSNKIRKQALKENIPLDDILQLARATEATELQIKDIECSKPRNVSLVDMKNNFKKKPTIKKCYRCGGTFPHQGFDCPAIGKRCSNCKKMNHFAKVCRSKSSPEQIREIENKVSSADTDDENFE